MRETEGRRPALAVGGEERQRIRGRKDEGLDPTSKDPFVAGEHQKIVSCSNVDVLLLYTTNDHDIFIF